jgi:hypothetical protein
MKSDQERLNMYDAAIDANHGHRTIKFGLDLTTIDFLEWIADRLVNVYGENPNLGFVQSLRERAEALRAAREG